MATQQLLLIVLGVVIIGIMIVIGTVLFSDHSASTCRESISQDLLVVAAKAQGYRRKPKIQGGGGGSFVGFSLSRVLISATTANGTFSIHGSPSDSSVTIEGVGIPVGLDGVAGVKVSANVSADRIDMSEVN
jgi:hypothetical protein